MKTKILLPIWVCLLMLVSLLAISATKCIRQDPNTLEIRVVTKDHNKPVKSKIPIHIYEGGGIKCRCNGAGDNCEIAPDFVVYTDKADGKFHGRVSKTVGQAVVPLAGDTDYFICIDDECTIDKNKQRCTDANKDCSNKGSCQKITTNSKGGLLGVIEFKR